MTAVVVALDRSLSMPMNNLFFEARRQAIDTIDRLGTPEYSNHLHALVAFATRAAFMPPSSLPELEWDYDYGTNLEEALKLSESSLNGQPGTILLLSDLWACAHTDEVGEVVFQCPPAQETIDRTVDAIRRCGAADITIEAHRYWSGERLPEDEPREIIDAIVAAGGKVEEVFTGESPPSTAPDRPWRYVA